MQPFAHAYQPQPRVPRRDAMRESATRIRDTQDDLAIAFFERHEGFDGVAVTHDIAERLLDNAKEAQRHVRGDAAGGVTL